MMGKNQMNDKWYEKYTYQAAVLFAYFCYSLPFVIIVNLFSIMIIIFVLTMTK